MFEYSRGDKDVKYSRGDTDVRLGDVSAYGVAGVERGGGNLNGLLKMAQAKARIWP